VASPAAQAGRLMNPSAADLSAHQHAYSPLLSHQLGRITTMGRSLRLAEASGCFHARPGIGILRGRGHHQDRRALSSCTSPKASRLKANQASPCPTAGKSAHRFSMNGPRSMSFQADGVDIGESACHDSVVDRRVVLYLLKCNPKSEMRVWLSPRSLLPRSPPSRSQP
jgi:hypothetical protein